MQFERNVGQLDPAVRFVARAGGYSLFLTSHEAVFAPGASSANGGDADPGEPVRITLPGAAHIADAEGLDPSGGVTNYLLGDDSAGWHTNVPNYERVRYRAVYPGVDLVYRRGGEGGRGIEYDFELAPGADPSVITMAFEGGSAPSIDGQGDLVVRTGGGELRQHRPVVFQEVDGQRRAVTGDFVLTAAGTVGFVVGPYDRALPLVIDPALLYSTFLGGATGPSSATGVAADPTGNAYVVGYTRATEFPTKGAAQATNRGDEDLFVTKLNTLASGGASLVYSTYLGGKAADHHVNLPRIAVDGAGNAYVTSTTFSPDYPVTPANAFDTSCGSAAGCNGTDNTYADGVTTLGSPTFTSASASFTHNDIGLTVSGTNIPSGTRIAALVNGTTVTLSAAATATGSGLSFTIAARDPQPDVVLSKVNATGSALLYSTFLGGQHDDQGTGVAVDASSGNAYVAGLTLSSNFPTSASPYDATCGVSANCNATNKAGTGSSTAGSTTYVIAAPSSATVHDVGKAISGANLAAGTIITGVLNRSTVILSSAALGTDTGLSWTITANVPRPQAFVTKVNTAGSGSGSLVYSTYLGGSGTAAARAVAVDGSGRAYVTGETASADFPTVGGFQAAFGGATDLFVSKLDPAVAGPGGLLYSTFLGGSGVESTGAIAVDGSANAYVAGQTDSGGFPVANPYQSTFGGGGADAVVTKLNTAVTGPSSLVYSTYLGGTDTDAARAIALDGAVPPTATVVGFTSSVDFPQVRPMQPAAVGGFVTRLTGSGSGLLYSTYFTAESVAGVAVAGAASHTYLAGTAREGTPSTPGAYQPSVPAGGGAFLSKLDPGSDAPIVSQVDQRGGPFTGGTAVTITGSGFLSVSSVKFGVFPVASFTVNAGGNQITTASPACGGCTSQAAATVNVTVTTPGGTSAASNDNRFVYGDGIFSPAASCGPPCGGSAASVRLASGKVLHLAEPPTGTPAATSVYDPATGTWTASGTCPSPCGVAGASLTLLGTGKVLAAGGRGGSTTGAAFLFDPAAAGGVGGWAQTGSLATARAYHSATLLTTGPNVGKVLVAGGCNFFCLGGNDAGITSTELYDPVTGTWGSAGSLKTGRFAHSASVLSGPACSGGTPPAYCGKVLLAGGMSNLTALSSAELYDPLATTPSKIFTLTGSLARGRMTHTGTVLAGPPCSGAAPPAYCGKVLVSGGDGYVSAATPTAELYDPAAGTWAGTGSMAYARSDHTGTPLPDGTVLVTGSSIWPGANGDVAERYDPATGAWGSAGGMRSSTSQRGCCATLLAAGPTAACGVNCGRVLVVEGNRPNSTTELYTPLPKVSAITPTNASGARMSTVTVTGTGLAAVDKASFGSLPATSVVHDAANPDSVLSVLTTGAVAAGTVDLRVSSPGGLSPTSAADRFTFADWGLLRAITSPALASQISIDGGYTTNWADTYGTTYVKQPVGSHTVCFRGKEGFTPPPCQTVNVVAGTTAQPVGAFTPRGFLHVTLSPAVAATISVDGVRTDDFGVFTDFPTGSHTVCFGPVADFTAPGCRTVTVSAGATTDVSGIYTSSPGAPGESNKGLLRVTTSPAVASQITVNGNIADTYGTTYLKLDPGTYNVCFSDVEGFVTPPCQNVDIVAGQTAAPVGTFVQRGYLHVSTSPAVAATIYVDGVARNDFGLFTDVPTGSHQVCFGPAAGFANVPACQTVTVSAGATTDVAVAYT